MRPKPEVLVIGAGVSGLTTAVCLAEGGRTVRVWTRELPLRTTSCAAGAMWAPYLVVDERVEAWSEETRGVLEELARAGDTGVRRVLGREVARVPAPVPAWAVGLAGFRTCTADELPEGFANGWWYYAPLVDMPAYLRYLFDRLLDAGGTIERRFVRHFDEATEAAQVVVNCTGMGARHLVPDKALTPTRGQLVVVENPGIDRFFAEHDESAAPTYFLPHGDRVVLGGSADPGHTDLEPDLATAEAIRRRCAALEPALGRARVIEHRVGLRPTRARVRLERVAHGIRHIIHNYGHGGAGVTVSWGCAREVLRLANAI